MQAWMSFSHKPEEAALPSLVAPEWRNWQTRRTQNPVPARACGFDPRLRHSATVLETARAEPHRDPHRGRRLPRAERRHPGGREALVRARPRDGRRPLGLARTMRLARIDARAGDRC